MKRIITCVIGLVGVSILVCSCGKISFSVNLENFGQYNGQTARFKLTSNGGQIGEKAAAVISEGFVTFPIEGELESRLYDADVFIDKNNDGVCNSCGQESGEPAWRKRFAGTGRRFGNSGGESEVTISADEGLTDISPF